MEECKINAIYHRMADDLLAPLTPFSRSVCLFLRPNAQFLTGSVGR